MPAGDAAAAVEPLLPRLSVIGRCWPSILRERRRVRRRTHRAEGLSAARTRGAPPIAATRHFPTRQLPWSQRGGTINDASCLNRTPVHGVVECAR